MFDKLKLRKSKDSSKHNAQDQQHSQQSQFAPNTKIAYKPKLVPKLIEEHRALTDLYWQILTAAQNNEPDLTRSLLVKFKDLFVDHLLKENTSIYLYLSHSAKEQRSRQAVKSVKAEMDEIGRQVMRFIDNSTCQGAKFDSQFVQEFQRIGEALTRRIEMEEEYVYPSYRPSALS